MLKVAKSTVYGWTHHVEFMQVQQAALRERLRISRVPNYVRMTEAKQRLRSVEDTAINAEAGRTVQDAQLTDNGWKLILAVLFWCEGQKDTGEGIKFINSDPQMVRLFLHILRTQFPLQESKFRALLHLHDYHDEQEQLKFWSDVTRIPISQFHRSYRKPHTGKNTRDGYPGCISIRYSDVRLAKTLKMIYSTVGTSV